MRASTVLAVASLSVVLSPFGLGPSAGLKDAEVAAWVRHQVQSVQPTPEERRFDEIGWAKSILEAEQLARQHNRPVFLFTHDGAIATGRC